MKKITLNNFLRMSPEAPVFTDRNQHYLISGANPTYYTDSPDNATTIGIQEQQVAPLIASQKWISVEIQNDKLTDITESTEGTYDFYYIDNTSYVSGHTISPSARTGCKFPYGSALSGTNQKIKCFANKLLAVTKTTTAPNVYYTSLPANSSSTWVASGFTISADSDPHYMENFLEYCMMTDNTSQIIKIDSSMNKITGIDLGTGWSINGMRNYNDKYLAIAGSSSTFNNNYLFLWNGRDDTYNYSIKMAGKFMDMKVIDGTLYVAVWLSGSGNVSGSGKTELYYLSGTTLKPVTLPQVSTIKTGFKSGIFSILNKIGLNLYSNELMLSEKTDVGASKFIINNDKNFYLFSETFSGWIVGVAVYGQVSRTYYFPTVNVNSTFNTISYKSHWIPVKNLSGIDIYYDTPPQSGTDAINVTIYGRGEDIITGSSTTVLASITPTNYLNAERTRLDVAGFTGDLCKIELTTVNSGSWRPIIRAIELITE